MDTEGRGSVSKPIHKSIEARIIFGRGVESERMVPAPGTKEGGGAL
jgi:hypothetical protein